jgi:protein TonB
MPQYAYRNHASGAERGLGLALTFAAHGLALAALVAYAPTREAVSVAVPIMVRLLTTPPAAEPLKPRLVPQPRPVPLRTQEPPPQILVAPVAAPAPAPHAVAPQPEPPGAVPPIAGPVAVAPAQPPLIPPRFDAAYLDNPAPAYPSLARRMREQGKVMLRVLVSASGAAERVELRASSGSERLDLSALETVRRWRFVPAKQGADAVSAWVLVPISFSLEG